MKWVGIAFSHGQGEGRVHLYMGDAGQHGSGDMLRAQWQFVPRLWEGKGRLQSPVVKRSREGWGNGWTMPEAQSCQRRTGQTLAMPPPSHQGINRGCEGRVMKSSVILPLAAARPACSSSRVRPGL